MSVTLRSILSTLPIPLNPRLVAQPPTFLLHPARSTIRQTLAFACLVQALKHPQFSRSAFGVPHCTSDVAAPRRWWLGDVVNASSTRFCILSGILQEIDAMEELQMRDRIAISDVRTICCASARLLQARMFMSGDGLAAPEATAQACVLGG